MGRNVSAAVWRGPQLSPVTHSSAKENAAARMEIVFLQHRLLKGLIGSLRGTTLMDGGRT